MYVARPIGACLLRGRCRRCRSLQFLVVAVVPRRGVPPSLFPRRGRCCVSMPLVVCTIAAVVVVVTRGMARVRKARVRCPCKCNAQSWVRVASRCPCLRDYAEFGARAARRASSHCILHYGCYDPGAIQFPLCARTAQQPVNPAFAVEFVCVRRRLWAEQLGTILRGVPADFVRHVSEHAVAV